MKISKQCDFVVYLKHAPQLLGWKRGLCSEVGPQTNN